MMRLPRESVGLPLMNSASGTGGRPHYLTRKLSPAPIVAIAKVRR